MFGGQSASRKFGGPEIYVVARRALIAGEAEGKRRANSFAVYEAVSGALRTLSVLSAWTMAHSYTFVNSWSRREGLPKPDMRYRLVPT